jgi:hypothetical protein
MGTPAQKAKASSSDVTPQMQSVRQRGHRKTSVTMVHAPSLQPGAMDFVASSNHWPLTEHDFATPRLGSDTAPATLRHDQLRQIADLGR